MLSFWEKDQLIDFDFAIAGGGILGLFTAFELSIKYPKARIAIFEKSMYGQGATTRNAGFACFGSMTEIAGDRRKWGDEKTLEIIGKRWRGIQKIKNTLGSQIDYENYGGYELIFQTNNIDSQLDEINHFLFPIFQKNIFSIASDNLRKFGFGDAVKQLVFNPIEGQLHSGKLVLALHKLLQKKGVSFFSNSEITNYQSGERVYFSINHRQELSTTKLIFCTNALAPSQMKKIVPARGQVLITEPLEELKFKGCFHFDEGFYYFRNVGNRILLGGGRQLDIAGETTISPDLNEKIQLDLNSKLQQIISPGFNPKIEMRWSGIMSFSENKLPINTLISKNVCYAMICNGMGVSLSPIAAEKIVDIM
jgi:glycine/D-amino acid oxidase-like deaminating enzyme